MSNIASNTSKRTDSIERVGQSFDELSRASGIIEQPVAPYEFYHNARVYELRGDYAGARQAYLGYFQFAENKLDPAPSIPGFLKIQEVREGARETYASIANRADSLVSRYASALLWDRDRRIELLMGFEKPEPTFVPLYFHLSQEYSTDRVGAQSIENQRREKRYLELFQTHDRAGQLARYFIDQEMIGEWRKETGHRLKALSSRADTILANSVNLTWMTSGSGWHGNIQVAEAVTEVFWRTAEMVDFKNNAKTTSIDTRTGQAMLNPRFVLPLNQSATPIEVKYFDPNGEVRGPYRFNFDPRSESWANDIPILNMLPSGWISHREYGGEWLVYSSHVMGHHGALKKIEYGHDSDLPDQAWPFSEWEKAGLAPLGPEVELYRAIPADTKFMTVRLFYQDGTVTEITRFDR